MSLERTITLIKSRGSKRSLNQRFFDTRVKHRHSSRDIRKPVLIFKFTTTMRVLSPIITGTFTIDQLVSLPITYLLDDEKTITTGNVLSQMGSTSGFKMGVNLDLADGTLFTVSEGLALVGSIYPGTRGPIVSLSTAELMALPIGIIHDASNLPIFAKNGKEWDGSLVDYPIPPQLAAQLGFDVLSVPTHTGFSLVSLIPDMKVAGSVVKGGGTSVISDISVYTDPIFSPTIIRCRASIDTALIMPGNPWSFGDDWFFTGSIGAAVGYDIPAVGNALSGV